MQRRSALVSLGAMCFGMRFSRVIAARRDSAGLAHRTAAAAARVAAAAPSCPNSLSAARLCQLVSVRLRDTRRVSPALVQASLDACLRSCRKLPHPHRTGTYPDAVAEFRGVAKQFIESTAV